MKLFFLEAPVRLSKHYELVDGQIQKTAYPNAYEFTSHEEDCPDLATLTELLKTHGAAGHCLLKGILERPLKAESRAGSTSSDRATDWGCFDLDGANYPNPDSFMASVGLSDVSYVLQWSASSGIVNTSAGLRCHILFQLDKAYHPTQLKQWLQHLNLTVQELRSGTALTKTSCALTWPLDITTCQNDKLLYISPPELGPGLVDPYKDTRVLYVQKAQDVVVLPAMVPNTSVLRQMMDTRINELRKQHALPARKTSQYKHAGQVEYMTKPERAIVTDIKQERGFVYLNLNGGDSWAYYHPDDNCEFIYNFKGEPVYMTKELCPDYYQEASKHTRTVKSKGRMWLAFRDRPTATYWNGWYDPNTDILDLTMAKTSTQVRDFMKQHGQPLGDFIPDWERVWDPQSDVTVDETNRKINLFDKTEVMRKPIEVRTDLPPLIKRLVIHLLGIENDKDELYEAFNNWMAVIFQHRRQTYTAWLFQGTQGTGKGLFNQRVLKPILGNSWSSLLQSNLESEFTAYVENKLILTVEEIQTSVSLRQAKVISTLKTIIGDGEFPVRRMYMDTYNAKNRCNVIMTSNMDDAVELPPDDRRINVSNFQRTKLDFTDAELQRVEDGVENWDAYCYWMTRPADKQKARQVLDTAARRQLIATSMLSADAVARALLAGDLGYFVDLLPTETEEFDLGSAQSPHAWTATKARYRDLMKSIIRTQQHKLSRDELYTIFQYAVGNAPQSPNKFTSYLRHHSIHMSHIKKDRRTVKGILVHWKIDPVWLQEMRTALLSPAELSGSV
jgi:hypothetical protein